MRMFLDRKRLSWKLLFLSGMSSGSHELRCSFHVGLFKAMRFFFRISLPEAKGELWVKHSWLEERLLLLILCQ